LEKRIKDKDKKIKDQEDKIAVLVDSQSEQASKFTSEMAHQKQMTEMQIHEYKRRMEELEDSI
jgi:hypothetical protein